MAGRIIGIIPAKGQSSLSGKNLREVGGFALLIWAIEASVRACDMTIVSSEDEDILNAAAEYHSASMVYPLPRPAMYAQPTTPDLPVIQHAYHLSPYGYEPDDVIVILRPTSPFRKPEEIRAVAELCQPMFCDSVRSVIPAREHPAKMYRETGWVQPAWQRRPIEPATVILAHEQHDPRYPMLEGWSDKHHRPNHPRQFLPKAWRACGFIDAVRGETVRLGSL